MGNIQFRNGEILFVDNKIAFGPECCDTCPIICGGCSGDTPQTLQVTFANLSNKACTSGATDCTSLTGVPLILQNVTGGATCGGGLPGGTCIWELSLPDICNGLLLDVFAVDSTFARLNVRLWNPACGARTVWRSSQIDLTDCENFNVTCVPAISDVFAQCSGSTVTVVAL